MAIEHVIHLTGGRCALYSWSRDRFAAVLACDPAGGLTPLLDRLQAFPPAPIAILADLVEEEQVRDKVPRLGRRDQQAVLERRLARAFPRASYRATLLQGREDSDPPAQRVLFCALGNAGHLGTLLAELNAARLPVAVVTTPALLCAPVLRTLRPAVGPGSPTLLVSRQAEGGLRISFFRGLELLGSRLLRPSVAAPAGELERLQRQLEESVRYFEPAFVPGATNPVRVVLLAEPGLASGRVPELPQGSEAWRLEVPDLAALAGGLGIRAGLGPGLADQLFIELLRRQSPAANFAGAADLRYFRLHQTTSLGRAACVALAGAGLLGLGLNAVAIVEAGGSLASTRAAVGQMNAQLAADDGATGTPGADPLEMQRTVAAWRALQRHRADPQTLLAAISRAVSAQPRIQVDAIQWSPLASMGTATEDAEPGLPEGEDGSATAAEAGADGEAAEAADAPQRFRITVKGRVDPFDHDYGLAFAELQAFMNRLRQDPRVAHVVARKQPLDVDPHSTLSGEMSRERREEDASFAVEVVMRMNDERA